MTEDAPTPKSFVISRTFDAPADRVWAAWTDPDRLDAWFGPKGTTTTVLAFDLRPGGLLHSRLEAPGGMMMWAKFVYREVERPARLAWAHSFADAQANIIRAPFSPSWPLELLTTVTFVAEGDNRTTVTLTWTPLNPDDAERKTFEDGILAMAGGWGGSFDQLAAYLAGA